MRRPHLKFLKAQALLVVAFLFFGLLILALLTLFGCNGGQAAACADDCTNGTACDEGTGLCEVVPLSRYEGDVPGRAVRLAADGPRLFAAMIEPREGYLLVGHIDRNKSEFRILEGLQRIEDKRLSVASSSRRVIVVWLGPNERYRAAMKPTGAPNEEWTFIDITPGPDSEAGYRGSEDFDVVLDEFDRIHLIFFDRQRRSLRHLHAPATSGSWEVEDVDDGLVAFPLAGCSVERRQALGLGVGLQPNALVQGEELFVAYHDADCGDLRLARRLEGRWVVSVVDNGEHLEEGALPEQGAIVGRFPSIAADSQGNIAVAYHDVSRGRVLFVRVRDGDFSREIADQGIELDEFSQQQKQLVGAFTRLTYDRNDTARLVYMNGTRNTLRRAHRVIDTDGSSRWLYRALDEPGPVGFFADQIMHPELGRVVAAERLLIADGLVSELVVAWEER